MSVDPLFAQWLQADADHVVRPDDVVTARWGATAKSTERLTGIVTKADAAIEADRNLAFFRRGPFAIDVHQVVGTDWLASIGTVVTMTIDDLGYQNGVDVFVLGADVDRATGISEITVIMPLGAPQ